MKYTGSLVIITVLLVGCFQSDYTRMVKSELAKGVRQDSILLGLRFGDTQNDFYAKCLDLNAQHLVTQGGDGVSVQYLFEDSLFHDSTRLIRVLFVPNFDKETKIHEMDVEFTYPGWSPWAKDYQSDKLYDRTLKILKHWYKGNDFVMTQIGDKTIPAKVDGNRRILVYIEDERNVAIKIQDLLHPIHKHTF